MTEQWQLFLFLAGLIAAWSLVILGAAKWMIGSTDKKGAALGKAIEQLPDSRNRQRSWPLRWPEYRLPRPSVICIWSGA
jgi:hypothetical protein